MNYGFGIYVARQLNIAERAYGRSAWFGRLQRCGRRGRCDRCAGDNVAVALPLPLFSSLRACGIALVSYFPAIALFCTFGLLAYACNLFALFRVCCTCRFPSALYSTGFAVRRHLIRTGTFGAGRLLNLFRGARSISALSWLPLLPVTSCIWMTIATRDAVRLLYYLSSL